MVSEAIVTPRMDRGRHLSHRRPHSSVMVTIVIVTAVVVILALLVVGPYNGLVRWRNHYRNAWAQIDVQLKRRYDLIPNLVEATRAYLSHERGTLDAVISPRAAATSAAAAARLSPGDPSSMAGLAGAEGSLRGALGRLFALVEAYPNLKADKTIARLTEELTSTENRIGFARQAFNDTVTAYNTAREVFPAVLFAAALGFGPAQLLEATATPAEREVPRVVLP